MKKLTVLIIALLLVTAAGVGIYLDGTHLAQYRYTVSYLEVEAENVPDSFEDFRILYLTDLEYGSYVGTQHLQKLTDTISALDYDLVIFGGDLFDSDYIPVSDDITQLTSFFAAISGRYGSLAITGEMDRISDGRRNITAKILEDAGFELIEGAIRIHHDNDPYITVYALAEEENEPVNTESVTIGLAHDYSHDLLPEAQLVLAGHAHDRQINLPFVSSTKLGRHGNLYRSRGLGLTGEPIRIFSDPELVIITFHHKAQ